MSAFRPTHTRYSAAEQGRHDELDILRLERIRRRLTLDHLPNEIQDLGDADSGDVRGGFLVFREVDVAQMYGSDR